jgi:hypothetical protein
MAVELRHYKFCSIWTQIPTTVVAIRGKRFALARLISQCDLPDNANKEKLKYISI